MRKRLRYCLALGVAGLSSQVAVAASVSSSRAFTRSENVLAAQEQPSNLQSGSGVAEANNRRSTLTYRSGGQNLPLSFPALGTDRTSDARLIEAKPKQ
jgi:hypothetical protein